MNALSPSNYVESLRVPAISISHDRDDTVIPVGESRSLQAALSGRTGVTYTEFAMFQHADPTKRNLTPLAMARQLTKFYLWLSSVFVRTIQ